MTERISPLSVIPQQLARAVEELETWFVIGGHAVRCLCPYRPSRDVDFGVESARDLEELLAELQRKGKVEILERSDDTVHLRFDGINVSIFVLDTLISHVEDRRLTVTGILATKVHAILDRGTRRDFFDLYVTLRHQQLGLAEALAAVHKVYRTDVNDALLMRALTYFDDAEREAPLPGEGKDDWQQVKDYFLERVGQLLVPPTRALGIEQHRVDVAD